MAHLRWEADPRAVLLLSLLLLGATAAAPTAEQAARDARSAFDRAKWDEAQRIVDDALQRFGERDEEPVWSLRVIRAEILHARGDFTGVEKALDREPPRPLRSSEPAVRRLLVLGNAAISRRETQLAAQRYERARAIAAKHQPQMLGEVYAALAVAAPNLEKIEDYAKRAIAAARKAGKPRPEAQALAALQWQYANVGRYSDSIREGEKALAAARAADHQTRIKQVVGNLGWSYLELGDYEAATEFITLAEATAARMGAEGERISWLNQLGNLRAQQRDLPGAQRYFAEALRRGRAQGHSDLGAILANLATISIETGQLDAARRYNVEALALKRNAGDAEAVLRSLIIDARIASAAGDFARAGTILQGVIKDAKHDTTRWEARGRLAEVFGKTKRVDDAIAQFRETLDTVRQARAAIDTKELRLSFFNTTTDIFSAYLDFLISQDRLKGALDVTEEIRIDALDDALNEKSSLPEIDAREIAKRLNATIVSYWLGPRQSYVWKITPSEIRVAKLQPDSKITAKVDAYRKSLTGPRGTLELSGAQGQQLYDLLGRPRGSRVIIVPDGSLYGLNFETLVVSKPKPHYWIEDALVTEASSIRVLAQQAPARSSAPKMLLVGNPPSSDSEYPPLPKAGEEMRSVAKHFARAKVLEGPAATPGAYESASPQQFDFVHFVAHGTASRTRPLESAVILAGDNLLARDVVRQPRLKARLVTISSCHGAGTRAYTGEGLVGLAWAFLRAGASSVIAALWEVNDSATPQLMDRFYAKTAAGVAPAAALREAKLSLLTAGGVRGYARYWAPFVYYE